MKVNVSRPEMIFLVFLSLFSHSELMRASSAMPCDRMEYAQLKDSTRKELTETFCGAMRKSELNAELSKIAQELFNSRLKAGYDVSVSMRDVKELGEAQVSCLKVAESASSMIEKRFKAKPPICK